MEFKVYLSISFFNVNSLLSWPRYFLLPPVISPDLHSSVSFLIKSQDKQVILSSGVISLQLNAAPSVLQDRVAKLLIYHQIKDYGGMARRGSLNKL